jgi:hypothetical protein
MEMDDVESPAKPEERRGKTQGRPEFGPESAHIHPYPVDRHPIHFSHSRQQRIRGGGQDSKDDAVPKRVDEFAAL